MRPLSLTCDQCGASEFTNDDRHTKCHSCRFWNEKISLREEACVARVDGHHYIIGREETKPSFRGFGGQKFIFRFTDDRDAPIVESTNTWYQGEIPERFRADLPNNAVFVKGRHPGR